MIDMFSELLSLLAVMICICAGCADGSLYGSALLGYSEEILMFPCTANCISAGCFLVEHLSWLPSFWLFALATSSSAMGFTTYDVFQVVIFGSYGENIGPRGLIIVLTPASSR
jgi:hypothetical protein